MEDFLQNKPVNFVCFVCETARQSGFVCFALTWKIILFSDFAFF